MLGNYDFVNKLRVKTVESNLVGPTQAVSENCTTNNRAFWDKKTLVNALDWNLVAS